MGNKDITSIESVVRLKERFGYYPEVVLAYKIYRMCDNLKCWKKHGRRLSGLHLGRPPKVTDPQTREQSIKMRRTELSGKGIWCWEAPLRTGSYHGMSSRDK